MKNGKVTGGKNWNKVYVYRVLTNRKYLGEIVHKGKSYPGEHEAILDRRLWDQAQRIMAENYHARTMKTRQKAPAMLTGILRCGHCGKAMGSNHTKRHGKRYRYYVCNYAERNGYDACPVKSVAAGQIEGAVKDRIRVILRSPDLIARTFREVQDQAGRERAELAGQKERLEARLAELRRAIGRLAWSDDGNDALADELRKLNEESAEVQSSLTDAARAMETLAAGPPAEDEVRESLQKLDPLWDELFPAEKERIVKLLIDEVILKSDGLVIRIRLNGLNSLAAELQGQGQAELGNDGQTVDVRVPMEFRRRGGRKEIILPLDADTTHDVGPRRPIVVALARAYKWQKMLDTGEASSMDELAKKHGVDRSYVGRILKLSSLAPDIVAAILAGNEPSGMSLGTLQAGVPLSWHEQLATEDTLHVR